MCQPFLLDTYPQVRYDLVSLMSSMKKVLLIGFILVLLIAIPITVFLVQQQQKTKSSAVAATTISILPATQTVHVGDTVPLAINVNPATATTTNQISKVAFTISYDNTKLSVDPTNGFVVNGTPNKLTPTKNVDYGTNTVSVSLSANGDATAIIQQPTTIGTITFKVLPTTDTAPTQITFGTDTQVLSIGSTDQFNENVLASANPASLSIIGNATAVSPTVSITPTVIATPTATQAAAPTCSTLTADTASGAVPLNTNLTVTGSSSNSTISKVTFNFGDGQSQDISASGGIGTNSISVLQSHSYASAGTFQATATLTDANNAVSNSTTCSVAITVGGGGTTVAAPTAVPTAAQEVIAAPSPLPPTGPTDLIKIGSIGGIITLIGVVLLFAL